MSFIVKAVKSVVKAVGSIITGVVKAVGKVVSSVINFVASPFMGMFGTPDSPSDNSESQRQQGILIQQQGSNVNIPVVYGYRKLAGTVVFAETGSTNNQYLWVAYAFSEGPVEGIREIWIDDNLLPADTPGKINAGQIVEITDTTSKYKGRVKLQGFPGVYQSTPSASQIGSLSICKDAPSWKPSMHYNGVAVIFARYEWKSVTTQEDADNNPFGGNIPQLQISLLGRRVASLADSSSENVAYGASGYTERYSYNSAEILLDYLRNPRYGKGLSNSEIDWDSFRIAASKCATQVTYVTGITGPILTTHYVLDTGQTIFNNVKTLLTNMRGYLPYVQGKYKLKIEDAGNPTDILSGVATIAAAFTNDGRSSTTWTTGTRNIIGDITYTGIERSAKYNQVVVSYVDPDQKWSVQQVVYPESETERQFFQTRDGGRENKAEITFPGLTNYAIAKDFAKLIFNKSRNQDSCSFTGDSSCFDLEPGDNIYIDSKVLRFGLEPTANAIPWRIISIRLNNNYTFDIGCVRNPDSLYPYTRMGEIDQVIPTYVPKGASIYYPGIVRTPPTGLVTPNSAPWDTTGTGGTGGTVTNPPVVNPGGGGTVTTITGVGSISGTTLTVTSVTGTIQPGMYVTGGSILSNTQITTFLSGTVGGVGTYRVDKTQTQGSTNLSFSLTASTNNTPTTPNGGTALETVIDITRISYSVEGTDLYATLTYTKPSHAMYSGAIFYFKRTTDSFYKTQETTDIPAAGGTIIVKIGPLVSNYNYECYSRVRYSTGELSTKIAKFSFVPSATGQATNPTETIEVVASGWTLPTTPPPNPRDTYMTSHIINASGSSTTVLNAGVPFSPRRIRLDLKQETNNNTLFNFFIKGVNIYYRQNNKTVWKKSSYNFLPGTAEGSVVQINSNETTPAMNLGVAINTTTTPSSPGVVDNFDFVIRYTYVDDTESTFQMRAMNVPTEYGPFGTFLFNPFYGGLHIMKETVSEYISANSFIVEDSASPGYVEDALNISVDILSIRGAPGNTTTKLMQIDFTPPPEANRAEWAGLRIITMTTGAAVSTQITVDRVPARPDNVGQFYVYVPVAFNTNIEFVIIPLVYTAAGGTTPKEANTAFYGAGQIFYADGASQIPQLNLQKLPNLEEPYPATPTAGTARAKLGTAVATYYANPTIQSVTGTYVAASDPRNMAFTVTPVAVSSTNPVTASSLVGVNLYYKPLQFAYYRSASFTFASPLTPGSASASFNLSAMTPDPSTDPTPNFGAFGVDGVYDLVFRLRLPDGSESQSELKTQASVQTTGTSTSGQYSRANTNLSLLKNAPPGTVEDPRLFNFGLNSTSTFIGNSGYFNFYIDALTAQQSTYVAGAKIRYREVVIGSSSFNEWSSTAIIRDPVAGTLLRLGSTAAPLQANAEYEVVITPLVLYGTSRIEANNSWYGRGIAVSLGNIVTGMNFRRLDTETAIGNISTRIQQEATAFTIQVPSPDGWTARTTTTGTAATASTCFCQLKFSTAHITGYHSVDIYRRDVRLSSGSVPAPIISPGPPTSTLTKYNGLGRWEFCGTVTAATHAPVAGITTVNLRLPPQWNEYNPEFGDTRFPGHRKYQGFNEVNSVRLASTNVTAEYCVIVRTGGSGATRSTKATVLPIITQPAGYQTQTIPLALYPLLNTDTTNTYIKNVSDLNSLDVGTYRNLTSRKAQFTGSISGTTLTVTAMATVTSTIPNAEINSLKPGMIITNMVEGQASTTGNTLFTGTYAYNTGATSGVQTLRIVSQLTGTTGGVGTYQLNLSATQSSTTLYARDGAREKLSNDDIIATSGLIASKNKDATAASFTPPATTPTVI